MGTKNRNHCNICLWSKHVDIEKGDRRSTCRSGMQPVGLTFKHEGFGRQGEIMLVHCCAGCEEISINRLAADDNNEHILECFESSLSMRRDRYDAAGIVVLGRDDLIELRRQLFGG